MASGCGSNKADWPGHWVIGDCRCWRRRHSYRADFVLDDAPGWLRLWFHIPFIDRSAYPKVVARGHGFLTPHANYDQIESEVPAPGWRFHPPGYIQPGSEVELR